MLVPMAPLSAYPRFAGAAMFAVGALLLTLFPAHAFADDGTTISVGTWWEPYLMSAFGAIVTVFVGFITAFVSKKTGIDIDAGHRDALAKAAMTGIGLAVSKIGDAVGGKSIDVKSEIIARAVTYVQQAVPDALAHFGMTPDKLETFIEGKLGASGVLVPSTTSP